MTARRTCFLINSKSHRVARQGSWLLAAWTGLSPDAKAGIELFQVEDFSALGTDMSVLAARGFTRFFVEGGDGTVLAVLSAASRVAEAFDATPEYAILPGGSTNLAYKSFGFRAANSHKFARRFSALSSEAAPDAAQQRALEVTCGAWSGPVIGFVLSTGALARAMTYVQREFHGDGHRGSLAVARAICRFLTAPHSYRDRDGAPVLNGSGLKLEAEEVQYEGGHGLSLSTSLPRLSLGLNPFWGQGAGGIALTYARWPLVAFRSGLLEALTLRRRGRLGAKGFFSHRLTQMTLRPEAPIMIDGELFEDVVSHEVRVTLTEPLRFLR